MPKAQMVQSPNPYLPIIKIRNKLIDLFVDKEDAITGVLAGLLSGEPTFLLGEPGTAKTMIIDTLSRMINAKYFYYLLTRFTEPDEILGHIDVNALREGVYKRITKDKLPDSDIVFLDEIFKASSSIRNILLDIILNKRFYNGMQYEKVNIIALYTASNEISTDEEDQAFYDRLLIRVYVRPVQQTSFKDLIIKGLNLIDNTNVDIYASKEEILEIQKLVRERAKTVASSPKLLNKYVEALHVLESEGIHLTDRRKIKTLIVASAISVLYKENTITPDDVADALRYTAWNEPEDLEVVEKVINKVGLSSIVQQQQKLLTLLAELENAYKIVKKSGKLEDFRKLQAIYKKTLSTLKKMPKTPRILPLLKQSKNRLIEIKQFIDKYVASYGFGEEDIEA